MKQRNQVILRSFFVVRRRRSQGHARLGGVGVAAWHDGGVRGRVPEVAVQSPLAARPRRLGLVSAHQLGPLASAPLGSLGLKQT